MISTDHREKLAGCGAVALAQKGTPGTREEDAPSRGDAALGAAQYTCLAPDWIAPLAQYSEDVREGDRRDRCPDDGEAIEWSLTEVGDRRGNDEIERDIARHGQHACGGQQLRHDAWRPRLTQRDGAHTEGADAPKYQRAVAGQREQPVGEMIDDQPEDDDHREIERLDTHSCDRLPMDRP